MRYIATLLLLLVGCDSLGGPASLEEPNKYIPTLAAATLTINQSPNPTPSPSPTPSPNPAGICPNCKGSGKIGDGTVFTICPVCNGTGRISSTPPPAKIAPLGPVTSLPKSQSELRPAVAARESSGPRDLYTQVNWVAPEQAKALMQTTGKPVWFHCTDLQTCPVCIQLERTVFRDKNFIRASRQFVCVRVLWNHPWRPALTKGVTIRPLDCFAGPLSWNATHRSYCTTDIPTYINNLNHYHDLITKETNNAASNRSSRIFTLAVDVLPRQQQSVQRQRPYSGNPDNPYTAPVTVGYFDATGRWTPRATSPIARRW